MSEPATISVPPPAKRPLRFALAVGLSVALHAAAVAPFLLRLPEAPAAVQEESITVDLVPPPPTPPKTPEPAAEPVAKPAAREAAAAPRPAPSPPAPAGTVSQTSPPAGAPAPFESSARAPSDVPPPEAPPQPPGEADRPSEPAEESAPPAEPAAPGLAADATRRQEDATAGAAPAPNVRTDEPRPVPAAVRGDAAGRPSEAGGAGQAPGNPPPAGNADQQQAPGEPLPQPPQTLAGEDEALGGPTARKADPPAVTSAPAGGAAVGGAAENPPADAAKTAAEDAVGPAAGPQVDKGRQQSGPSAEAAEEPAVSPAEMAAFVPQKPVTPQPRPQPDRQGQGRAMDLQRVRTLYANGILADPRVRGALAKLPAGQRITQICSIEALEQTRRRGLTPDLLARSSDAGDRLTPSGLSAVGGAVRARGVWRDIAFDCRVDAEAGTITAFRFALGAVIPRAQWAARKLDVD